MSQFSEYHCTSLMTECWSLGCDYANYTQTADVAGKYAFSEVTYLRHCKLLDEKVAKHANKQTGVQHAY